MPAAAPPRAFGLSVNFYDSGALDLSNASSPTEIRISCQASLVRGAKSWVDAFTVEESHERLTAQPEMCLSRICPVGRPLEGIQVDE